MRFPLFKRGRRTTAVLLAGAAVTATGVTAVAQPATAQPAAPAVAAPCTDIDVVSARGSFEPGTLGLIVGDQVLSNIKSRALGKSVSGYPVNYPANIDLSGPAKGVVDLVNHVKAQGAACPNQKFVLVGYSQGAFIIDNALGMNSLGSANVEIPADLRPRVAAAIVFGDPNHLIGRNIGQAVNYVGRTKDFCASGDPVCGNGFNVIAHLLYFTNAGEAATFAMSKMGGTPGPSPTGPAPTGPAPTGSPAAN